jgi:hypothetical protein
MIPQSYNDAVNRTETMHEIHRLYDVRGNNCLLIVSLMLFSFRVVNEPYDDFERQLRL